MKKTYIKPEIVLSELISMEELLTVSSLSITVDKNEEIEENFSREATWDDVSDYDQELSISFF